MGMNRRRRQSRARVEGYGTRMKGQTQMIEPLEQKLLIDHSFKDLAWGYP